MALLPRLPDLIYDYQTPTNKMDTSYLEQQITAKEQEIADRQAKIDLLKLQINTDKQVLKVLRKGMEKIKEQSK